MWRQLWYHLEITSLGYTLQYVLLARPIVRDLFQIYLWEATKGVKDLLDGLIVKLSD